MNIHQVVGTSVDRTLEQAMRTGSNDNVTAVIVAFSTFGVLNKSMEMLSPTKKSIIRRISEVDEQSDEN